MGIRAQAAQDGQETMVLCLMLMRAKVKEIDIKELTKRFNETASYDVSEDRVLKNLEHFKKLINKERLAP
ncbi:MAG: hypothetical protein WC592_07385 [Candidatus Omnitrophota bacterium]